MFTKGQSGNPAGRPRGSTNKVSEKLRESLSAFLDAEFERVKNDFTLLKPYQRVKFYIEFLQYTLPKLQSITVDEFENMTDADLDEVVRRLKAGNDGTETEN